MRRHGKPRAGGAQTRSKVLVALSALATQLSGAFGDNRETPICLIDPCHAQQMGDVLRSAGKGENVLELIRRRVSTIFVATHRVTKIRFIHGQALLFLCDNPDMVSCQQPLVDKWKYAQYSKNNRYFRRRFARRS